MAWRSAVAWGAALSVLGSLPLRGCASCTRAPRSTTETDGYPSVSAPSGPKPTLTPPASASSAHPRLLVRDADLARLRSWAAPNNPIFAKGLSQIARECVKQMDAGEVPTKDPATANGYTSYPTEAYAELFAFMSLVSPTPAERDDYAKRARSLLMYAIRKAALGPASGQPFRDKSFATGDRSRWSGEAFALTVDWIHGTLSADDKATIRSVFLRWAEELMRAETTTDNHPEPAGMLNDPKLLEDRRRVRWAGNNYYTAHMRNLGLMALALDPADDPQGKLQGYLASVTGAWLYVSDALMRGDMRGGLPAEGFEYSPQAVGYVAQLLLALETAGRAAPASYGVQATFANPFWNDVVPAYLHSLSPVASAPKDPNYSDVGPVYSVAWYGDGQKFWAPDYMGVFGPLGLHDELTGGGERLGQLRWIETNLAPGGPEKLLTRAGNIHTIFDAIFYFLLFDPKAKAAPDPRPTLPLTHFAPGLGRILARTSWGPDASWFTYKLGWTTIDHQGADGNMFELYRKGEWLTKERTGYGNDVSATDYKNSLALQNDPPSHMDGYRGVEYRRGSQWLYVGDGDGKLLATSFGAGFVYALGDATALYDSKYEKSTDIVHASRSIVWLAPDRVVIYDRAASKTAGRFKRFWLNLPEKGAVSGGLMTMSTASGQQLFVRSLLPSPASVTVEPAEPLSDNSSGTQPASLDPIRFRLRVEAPGGPKSVRFLHVVEGADRGAVATPSSVVSGTTGAAFEGAAIGDVVVLFPVDLGADVATLTYAAPAAAKAHLVTGLLPDTGYAVSQSSTSVTVTKGGDHKTDAGGVLVIGKLP